LSLRLPPPIIADLIIEDATSKNYPYPDAAIEPEEWKKIAAFVEEKIRILVIEEGILLLTEEKGRQFIERFFLDAGYSTIIFL